MHQNYRANTQFPMKMVKEEIQQGNLEQITTHKVHSWKELFYVAHNIICIYTGNSYL